MKLKKSVTAIIFFISGMFSAGFSNAQIITQPTIMPKISDAIFIGNSDFEGDDYGDWIVKGNAFGLKPMNADQFSGKGVIGKRLASSIITGNENATGSLTSPEFMINRKYVNFLISGGNWPGQLKIKLLIEGKEVCFNTGNQFDDLFWMSWNLSSFEGMKAIIIIEDNDDGRIDRAKFISPEVINDVKLPMAHISIDQIFQSDVNMQYREKYRPQFHFSPARNWMNDPNGLVYADSTWHLFAQHDPYLINRGLANEGWLHAMSSDLIHWSEDPAVPTALLGDTVRGMAWTGAGLVDDSNQLHLKSTSLNKKVLLAFYLRTKKGLSYAYSNDGGKQWFDFSENPVIPWANTAQSLTHNRIDAPKPTRLKDGVWIAPIFDDRENPVVKLGDASKGTLKRGTGVTFIVSDDLKKWYQKQKQILGFGEAECMDAFEMPVYNLSGEKTKNTQWVMNMGYDGYALANLTKSEEADIKNRNYNFTFSKKKVTVAGSVYCPMTWYNAPDNRRIQITWANHWGLGGQSTPGINYPDMPFKSQMTFPIELKMVDYGNYGRQLTRTPVKEIASLYSPDQSKYFEPFLLSTDMQNVLAGIKGSLFDIEIEFESLDTSGELFLQINDDKRDYNISYEITKNQLRMTGFDFLEDPPIEAVALEKPNASVAGQHINLRILIDRSLVEAFAGDGRLYFIRTFFPEQLENKLKLYAKKGRFKIHKLAIRKLRSMHE